MSMFKIESYRTTRGGAEDPAAKVVTFGWLTVYFSYRTPVSFQVQGESPVTSENAWSRSTGTHLNIIEPDKKKRIPYKEFQDRLCQVFQRMCGQFQGPPPGVIADCLDDMFYHDAADAVRTRFGHFKS